MLGANYQTWLENNLRPMLKRIVDANPTADEAQIRKLLRKQVDKDPCRDDYHDGVWGYWVRNNLRSYLDPAPAPRKGLRPASAAELAVRQKDFDKTFAETKTAIAAQIDRSAKLVLLDMVLPNGKKLRHATGSDCKAFAPKFGIWFGNIARKLKPGDVVGKVLTEKEVREIYDGA